jgi:hypothetical protein
LKAFQLSVTDGKFNGEKERQFSWNVVLFSGVKVDNRPQGYTMSELRNHNLEISTVETLTSLKNVSIVPLLRFLIIKGVLHARFRTVAVAKEMIKMVFENKRLSK